MLDCSENYKNYHELSLKNVKKYTFLLKRNQWNIYEKKLFQNKELYQYIFDNWEKNVQNKIMSENSRKI